jgi:hypothetical protein
VHQRATLLHEQGRRQRHSPIVAEVADEPDDHEQDQAPQIGRPQQVAERPACRGWFDHRRPWRREAALRLVIGTYRPVELILQPQQHYALAFRG